MEKPLYALILEDSLSDTLLLLRELRRDGYEIEHTRVDNAEDMIAALDRTSWDIIISDYSMPGFSATTALKLMQERKQDIPFIIVSGTMGEEVAVEAMKAGAHDYFPKGRITRLGAAIEREIREVQERAKRQRAEEELRQTEAELLKNVQLIQLLQSVTVAANEANEVNEALQFALEQVCRFADWPLGHVYLRAKGEQPHLTSTAIWYSANLDEFTSFRDASERLQLNEETGGLIYHVLVSGNPTWLIDLEHQTDFLRRAEAQHAGIRSVYAFPIHVQHEVVAVMEFFSLTAIEPDQGLLDTIPHIATQLGHVIERVRTSEEIRAMYNATGYLFNADTFQDLAQQIVHAVVNEFEQVDCGLLWVDQPSGQINRLARAGQYQVDVLTSIPLDGPGLVAKAIRENRLVYAPDVQQDTDYMPNMPETRSEMAVPLRTRDRVIGALDLQSTRPDYFDQRDERILGAFAERAAAALEIVGLYEAINRHAAGLELRVEERTQELQEAKERVEAILNNSSDAIILVDADGVIQQTNPQFVEIFGYDYDELFGQRLSQVVLLEEAGEDSVQFLKSIVINRAYQRLETLVRRKDGTTFPADAAFAAFASNHEIEIVCSLRDISAQKQLEQELRLAFEQQKELADLKTRFISTVSHEYRTPLATISAYSNLLQRYSDRLSEDEKQDRLETIQTQVERLTALLDDVLEISRAETIRVEIILETIDLADLCREIVADFQHINPDHHIELRLSGEVTPIIADAKLMRQMISNLVSNAVKYSPNRGTVETQLTFEEQQIILTVKDQGLGIPEDDLDKLFTTFHRARNVGDIQGTGLGLAIVKQAVEAHGGTISVESTIGVGTNFTVVLPR